MKTLWVLVTAAFTGMFTVAAAQEHSHAPGAAHPVGHVRQAVAVLVPIGGSGVQGTVYFTEEGEGDQVHVSGKIVGLKPGEHAFHVHDYGDLTDVQQGLSAGSHYNPEGMPHGRPGDQKRHAGDFGNIMADQDGTATIDLKDSVVQLNGPHSILGRGLVVHVNPDKFTQPVGDAGPRVAVGVIGLAQPAEEKQKAGQKPAK